MKPSNPGHPRYTGLVESARRHLVRYGVEGDEAITLAVDLTKRGFMLEPHLPVFRRLVDRRGLIAQTVQFRHQNNMVTTRIYEVVTGRDLIKESTRIGITAGGGMRSALGDVDNQCIAALRLDTGIAQEQITQQAMQQEAAYGAHGEHPDHSTGDWHYANIQGWTDQPYWEWVALRLDSIGCDEDEESVPRIASY